MSVFHSTRMVSALLLSAVLSALPPLALAQSGAALTLDEALRLAAAQSRQLVAQDAAVSAARAMSVAAGQLPDPVLRLGIDNVPANGTDAFSIAQDFMTMRRIGVMQELTRSDKRELRAQRSEQEAQREATSRTLVLANLQRDTALAWLDRYYAQRVQALVVEQQQEARLQIEAADSAYRAGRGGQADVFAARAALVALEDRASQVERQIRTARAALARWIGAEAQREPAGRPDIHALRLDTQALEEELQHHPQVEVLAKQVAVADTEARLARANKSADWSLEVAYAKLGANFSDMISVGVAIPLQIARANRQDREEAAKLALLEQARAQREDALRAHVAEVRAMLAEWEIGRERLARYESSLIPLASQRTGAALTAYRAGTGPLFAVLEARRDELATRTEALQLENEIARAWAQLNFLVPRETGPLSAAPIKEPK